MFSGVPQICEALKSRNQSLAQFWFMDPSERVVDHRIFINKRCLMIDAEDSFTAMLTQLLEAVGLEVTLRNYCDENLLNGTWDLVVFGPGPGDPRKSELSRMFRLKKAIKSLYQKKSPFFAVCLSHQLLCLQLGSEVIPCKEPNQGVQRKIELFGKFEHVGFYNTFVAKTSERLQHQLNAEAIEICYDPKTSYIHALKSENFVSLQFHPESILTQHGINIITHNIGRIIR